MVAAIHSARMAVSLWLQRSAAGSHNDSEGKKATTSSTASAANQNDQIVRMLWPTLILPMAVPMNSTEPTGA